MDLMFLRQHLIAERGRLGMTQEEMATKAGIRQSLVSKWEDLSIEMTDPSARVLFLIIERAFEKSLTEFFAEIEKVSVGAKAADGGSSPQTEGRAHADSLSSTISRSDLERFARAIGRSIGREIRPQATRRSAPKARARRAKRR
jgi:transcriptional regulator with XRE-family HTH domain